ncbi:MAG: hypothetical protein M1825_003658 [Sarcosagium campestre]|nr:MAG: hypothetical protein M1825_003658 [Sarcosagium campestre]
MILLHGRGSNGPKFGSALLESPSGDKALALPALFPGFKFICPTAAKRRCTALKRVQIHQWFDNHSLVDCTAREDLQVDGLQETAAYVRSLIDTESRAIPTERIFVAGLSQGCAAAVYTLLTLDWRLAGFIGMSGWLPFERHISDIMDQSTNNRSGLSDDIKDDVDSSGDVVFETEAREREQLSPRLQALSMLRENIDVHPLLASDYDDMTSSILQTPVLIGHGALDEKVDYRLGSKMATTLKSLGMPVEFITYTDLGHWYKIPEQIEDIVVFLNKNIGNVD